MFDFSREPSWVVHSSFDPVVDFCVWMLEVDGLLVSPFDQHLEGNAAFRARGMDANSWLLWMKRVVLLSDQRIYWSAEKLRVTPQNERNSEFVKWQEWQHQQAMTVAREFCGSQFPEILPIMPPEVFPAASPVKELIEERWMYYRSDIFSRREQRWSSHPIASLLGSELVEAVNSYYPRLAALELYLVAYSEPREYLIPPVSVIVSLPDDSSNDDLTSRVLLAVETLASLGSSDLSG